MGRPRETDDKELPPYVYLDKARGGYIIKNPLGEGRVKREPDRARAIAMGKKLAVVLDKKRQLDLLNAGQATIAAIVDKFVEDRLDKCGWKASTRKNNLSKLMSIRAKLGHRFIARTDSLVLTEWLQTFAHTADTWNKWRYLLILLWRYAISIKKCEKNEAEAVLEESQSLNRESNRKSRLGLTIEGYLAIYVVAEPWLKLAMDLSFVTMVGRNEVCEMKHSDFRGGWFYVIRKKTSAKSKEAFFRFPVNEVLRDLRVRAMTLDTTECPNLIHRQPDRKRADWEAPEGEHPYYVRPEYLTNAFAAAVRRCGFFDHYKPEHLPSFHEVRGLASRRYKKVGAEDAEIQAMLGHASPAATKVYLEGGKEALHDDHYAIVEAPLSVADLLEYRGVLEQNSSNTPVIHHHKLSTGLESEETP